MGKTGEERAVDSELRVLDPNSQLCPYILAHLFAHPDSGQTAFFVYEYGRNDQPWWRGGMLELEDTLEISRVFLGTQGWRLGKAGPRSRGRTGAHCGSWGQPPLSDK